MRPDSDPKAEQNRKIFVGGLHPKTNEESLRAFYKQWGDITDVVVMRDPKSSKSRGFGFVTFALDSSVDEAQRSRPHTVDGKEVDSKRAMPRDDTSAEVHAPVKKIFVGHLKKETTNSDLEGFFSQYGRVTDATVVMDRNTNSSRCFAFVTFDDNDSVDKVILARPLVMEGQRLDVHKAVDRNDKQNRQRQQQKRMDYNSGWNDNGSMGYQQQGCDQGYQQYYGQPPQQQNYYGDSNYGYNNYGASAPPPWQGSTDGFGSYQQQAYAGGPMRQSPAAQHNRPAPYAGNGWSQR